MTLTKEFGNFQATRTTNFFVLQKLANDSIQQCEEKNSYIECGPMPNVMAALPDIGGALCSMPQSLADATTRVPCSNGQFRQ